MWTSGSLPARPNKMTLLTLLPMIFSVPSDLSCPVHVLDCLFPVDLDAVAVGIPIKPSGRRFDIQIAARIAVLVENDPADMPHIHEVRTIFRGEDALKRLPIRLANFDCATHEAPPVAIDGGTATCVCLQPRHASAPVILRIASSKRSGCRRISP